MRLAFPVGLSIGLLLAFQIVNATNVKVLKYEIDLSDVRAESKSVMAKRARSIVQKRGSLLGIPSTNFFLIQDGHNYIIQVTLPPTIKNIAEIDNQLKKKTDLSFRLPSSSSEELLSGWKKTSLSGKYLSYAQTNKDPFSKYPTINLHFTWIGKRLLQRITANNIGKPLAIFVNDIPVSIPVINTEIKGGEAAIVGMFEMEEAEQLAQDLNGGILPVPISRVF